MASVDVDLLMMTFDWSFVHLMLPVIVTTSIVFRFNKIQNGNILVLLTQVHWEKWPSKWRERRELFLHPTFSMYTTEIEILAEPLQNIIKNRPS